MRVSRDTSPPLAPADRAGVPWNELRGFPARLFAQLPVETRIHAHLRGFDEEIILTSGPGADFPHALTFDGAEVRALAMGLEAERLFPADLRGYCLLKLHDRGFRVTEALALAEAQYEPGPACSLDRLLAQLEIEVRTVELAEAAAPTVPVAA